MALSKRTGQWSRTRNLMLITIALCAVLSIAPLFVAAQANRIVFLGFPLGFYLAAQAVFLAFVALVFWFGWRQDALDDERG